MSSENGPVHELTLDLPAAHRGVRVARNLALRFARMQGMPQGEADAMALVLSEMLANAIDHGGGSAALHEDELGGDVRMRLTLALTSGAWTLTVSDQGGADPDEMREQLEDCHEFDLEHDRGRGLFLLKASVDELTVECSPDGKGLTFRATKAHAPGG